MLQMRRTAGHEVLEHEGRTFTLMSRSWSVRLATPWGGLGWVYRAPVAVRSSSEVARIRDHVMVARVAAALLLTLAALIARRRP